MPAIYKGKLKLQSDTTIVDTLRSMGISHFAYYQKVDSFFVEIINSDNREGLKNHETQIINANDTADDWKLAVDRRFNRSNWVVVDDGFRVYVYCLKMAIITLLEALWLE